MNAVEVKLLDGKSNPGISHGGDRRRYQLPYHRGIVKKGFYTLLEDNYTPSRLLGVRGEIVAGPSPGMMRQVFLNSEIDAYNFDQTAEVIDRSVSLSEVNSVREIIIARHYLRN